MKKNWLATFLGIKAGFLLADLQIINIQDLFITLTVRTSFYLPLLQHVKKCLLISRTQFNKLFKVRFLCSFGEFTNKLLNLSYRIRPFMMPRVLFAEESKLPGLVGFEVNASNICAVGSKKGYEH